MTTRMTVFHAELVQDSALSVSGLDRSTNADQPFTIVDGVPVLLGSGLKGAALAMAQRFFHPIPSAVSETTKQSGFRRSCWEFFNTRPAKQVAVNPELRAGVGIRQETGARAQGILYDREVIPSGTRWPLEVWVDWSHAINEDEAKEAEGILGYVLSQHWANGRCWLGGGAARGMGWCHLEKLQANRLDTQAYESWIASDRKTLPSPCAQIPSVEPTRSWCFWTLDLSISFGEYKPEKAETAWGLDMLAIGPHDSERTIQQRGDGVWAKPAWQKADSKEAFVTDRSIVMEGGRPLLPGSTLRGPLRHAYSHAQRADGASIQDPHPVQGNVQPTDLAAEIFGTVAQSSSILICDGHADKNWVAALLHMHAEDEFSAGSYGSAKRDAVRLLRGTFPLRIVVEGKDSKAVEPTTKKIDTLVALGKLGHLPIGGHKTRGAGWGRWQPEAWSKCEVVAQQPRVESAVAGAATTTDSTNTNRKRVCPLVIPVHTKVLVSVQKGECSTATLTLEQACCEAMKRIQKVDLTAWWCEPSIDVSVNTPPQVFGTDWPEQNKLHVDEVMFCTKNSVWRAARACGSVKWVFLQEVPQTQTGALPVTVTSTPTRLHGSNRFSSASTGQRWVMLREWSDGQQLLGYTISDVEQETKHAGN